MNRAKTDSTRSNSFGQRLIKFLRLGRNDVREVTQAAPHGIDSHPTKGLIAIYAPTGSNGTGSVIGYINPQALADVGELFLYSTDDQAAVQFRIKLRNNGTCEIGGDTDNMVRYSKLEDAFNELRDDFNTFVNSVYNVHVHPGVTPGSGSTAVTPTVGQASTADISPAKIDEIKTLA